MIEGTSIGAKQGWSVGDATLVAQDLAPDRVAELRRRLEADPVANDQGRSADVVLQGSTDRPTLIDVQNPSRDGTTTGWDGDRLWLLSSEGWCEIPAQWDARPLTIQCSHGFPIDVLLRRILLPTLQVTAPGRGAAVIHASACASDDGAVLIAGWSESGKTETALAMCELGAGFVSDKWTSVGDDGRVRSFPASVGIRRWVVPYLPRLRASLPMAARAQLGTAAAADAVVAPIVRASRGRARYLLEHVEAVRALADRAALTQRSLADIYPVSDQRPKVRTIAMLHVWERDQVIVRDADVGAIRHELARTAAYERRAFFELHDRLAYADDAPTNDSRSASIQSDERVLGDVLAGVRVVRVCTPFPVDPRRVASELRVS